MALTTRKRLFSRLVTYLIASLVLAGVVTSVQAAPSSASVNKRVKFQWLTVFDHSVLMTWPPKPAPESDIGSLLLNKLRLQLETSRTDIEFLPLVWAAEDLKEIERILESGQREYEALSHRKAAAKLSTAITKYYQLGWHLRKPNDVAHAHLLLAKTRSEQDQNVEAERLLRTALSLNPNLQIKEEFEHPKLVRLFKSARRSFLMRPPELPRHRSTHRTEDGTIRIHGRIISDRIELLIQSISGTRLEVETIDNNIDLAASRLASRILDCLPLNDAFQQPNSTRSILTSLGLGASSYLQSPVGSFLFYDTLMSFQYALSESLEWWTHFRVSNSTADESKHLRDPITSFSLSFGPRPRFRFGRASISVYLAPWIERRGSYRTTTNPSCKFFSPNSGIPDTLCDFKQEITTYDADWTTGINYGGQMQIRVKKRVYLSLDLSVHTKLIEDVSTSMQHLLASHVSVGYLF